MAIYKCGRGVEPGSAMKQLQIAVRAGLEPGTSRFQVRRPNHSAILLCVPYCRACHTAVRTIPVCVPYCRAMHAVSSTSYTSLVFLVTQCSDSTTINQNFWYFDCLLTIYCMYFTCGHRSKI